MGPVTSLQPVIAKTPQVWICKLSVCLLGMAVSSAATDNDSG